MEFRPTDNEIKLACQELITMNVSSMLDIEGRDNDNFYTLYCKGEEMGWEDFEIYDLAEPCVCECGEVVGVMLFGDGTLEIVFSNEEEPMCWSDLSAKDISKVCRHISEEHGHFLADKFGFK